MDRLGEKKIPFYCNMKSSYSHNFVMLIITTQGVEEVIPKMRVGDRWVLTIPVSCCALRKSGLGSCRFSLCPDITSYLTIYVSSTCTTRFRENLRLDQRDDLHLLESQESQVMPPLSLMLRWLVFQERNLSLLI